MDLNCINNLSSDTTASYSSNSKSSKNTSGASSTYGSDSAAVYEKSSEAKKAKSNSALVAKLKADTENRLNQMQNLVTEILTKQGKAVTNADSMWKALASGDFTVDSDTTNEAKEAISEDGYWGVNQTSDRIFDFAVALSGGDSEKMDKMLEAVKKGFQQATGAWGKSLPDISNQTYDAVMKKFDEFKKTSQNNNE